MDRALSRELGRLVAATRGWLEELHEEGVEALPSPAPGRPADESARPLTPERVAAPGRSPAAREPGALAAEPAAIAQLGLVGGAESAPWSASPTLEAVREALGECTRCRLHQGRSRIVFGDGNPDADLMFVGEGPGAEEDRRGVPFVGRAGELLTSMIEKGLGIPRRDVYICNIVKCRPPENRTPLADEAATCRPFLDGQIAAVRPRVIVALGKPAATLLLGREVSITRIRGIWHDYRGIPLMPTFHPAFVLRQYTQENRRAVWSDLRAALERARQPDQ